MKRRQRGLTLVELMVTLAVAITLLAIGIPAFQGIEANNRAAAQANSLVTALTLARSEAVARGVPVAVCAAASATTCAGTAAWEGGWLVFTDQALDVSPSTDELVRSFDRPRGNPTIAVATPFVRFNSRGELWGAAPAEIQFELSQAGQISGQTRCLRVMPSGQIVTERNACP
jgi:type IV fimbrial biogenesis protein FimT